MREYVEGLIAKYHDRGLLIDTNLLLLFVVGLFDSGLITQFKRTKQFVPEFRAACRSKCPLFAAMDYT